MPNTAVRGRCRPRVLLVVLAILVSVGSLTGCLPTDRGKVTAWINKDRGDAGLPALPINAPAHAKAQRWAEHLARSVDANGRPVLKHSNLRQGMEGVHWCLLGENIGFAPAASGFKRLEKAYMDSPGHRANILSTRFNRVGAGVAYTADGRYLVTVQEFVQVC